MIARLKRTNWRYRSFSPSEEIRMSARDAIGHVTNSVGVLVPFMSPNQKDAAIHNVRAAFITGLAAGMDKVTALLFERGTELPIDLRISGRAYKHPAEIDDHIHSTC